jgi:hypothetical protein
LPNAFHQESAARRQSLFRAANERVEALPTRPASTFIEFVCECCLDGCAETICLTGSEYDAVRRHPTWFAVLPGHVDRMVERVIVGVSEIDRYEVVDKIEAAGDVAASLDPRGPPEALSTTPRAAILAASERHAETGEDRQAGVRSMQASWYGA